MRTNSEALSNWERSLNKDQREAIRNSGLSLSSAHHALRRYDATKLTPKEIYSVTSLRAMGIV